MEERIATAIRFETTPQVAPPLNLVDSFVLNEALEHDGRRLPVDALQGEKPAVEPRSEQVRQIGVDLGAIGMVAKRRQQSPPQIHQDGRASRRHVAPPEQLLPRRFDRLLQRNQLGR